MEMARCDDQDFYDVCDAKSRLLPAYRQVSEPGASVTLGSGCCYYRPKHRRSGVRHNHGRSASVSPANCRHGLTLDLKSGWPVPQNRLSNRTE
jgi:hypothetical protein